MSDPRSEVPQTVQAMPSLGAIALYLSGKDINWWAAAVGLLFLIVQLSHVLWKWHCEWGDRKAKRRRGGS